MARSTICETTSIAWTKCWCACSTSGRACACEIGRLKKEQGIEVYQPEREKQVLAHVRSIASEGPLGADAIARLFERIIDEARRLERRVVHGDGAARREHA